MQRGPLPRQMVDNLQAKTIRGAWGSRSDEIQQSPEAALAMGRLEIAVAAMGWLCLAVRRN